MPAADIFWNTERERFNYRVAGVCVSRRHVLLCQLEGTDFWFIPGGLGKLREPATATLAREMREELDIEVRVGSLLWIIENFFADDGRRWHELGLYFRMSLPPDSEYLDTDRSFVRTDSAGESHLTFRWFSVDNLLRLRLFPVCLRTGQRRLPRTPRHIVEWDALAALDPTLQLDG